MKKQAKVKIGVIGAGHLGNIHIKLLKDIPEFELTGFYDIDDEQAAKIEKEHGIKRFNSADELIFLNDAVDIVTPTVTHAEYAVKALTQFKHVFIEKPLTENVDEAKHLEKLTHESNVKVQVGHVERFNPAFVAAKPYIDSPMFIETHRLAEFNPRGTDVSVVLDLMIHDIDIVLSVVNSNVRRISASGVSVVSDTPDIANARLEFDNGCVANLTASRISLKKMRKTRMFQRNAYVAVDFLEKTTEIVRLKDLPGKPDDPFALAIETQGGKGWKQIYFENPEITESNAIKAELESFANSIINDVPTTVSVHDGLAALQVAQQVIERIQMNQPL
jgi:predicted dehydrogenase